MGGAVKITRTDMSAQDLRCAAKRTRDGRVVRRILAIALVLDDVDRATAARSSGMDRQTLGDWVHRYNAKGLGGLSDRCGKGAKPRLSLEQQALFVAWVEAGPDPAKDGVVRWRCADLQVRVEEEFDVKLHERTIGKYPARHGFRRLSVRPEHPKTDPAAQQAFKKNLAQLALIMRGVLQAGCLRRRQVSCAAFGGSEGRQGGTTEGSCPGIWSRCPDGGAERSLTAHADCSRFECAIHHGHVLRRSGRDFHG